MSTIDYIALDVLDLDKHMTLIQDWSRAQDDAPRQPQVVLDCDDFQVRRREILGVLGGVGSGKSTLVRDVAALLVTDERHVTVSGHGILWDQVAIKRLINRVLTDTALFRALTPVENLVYGARLKSLEEANGRARAAEVLAQMGLDEAAITRPTGTLSATQQQQVAAACAALTQPALLVLDDPLAGLARQSREEAVAFLRELRDVYNATILLTTDDACEAEILCDRVAILDAGRIVALDTPANLKRLLSSANGCDVNLADVQTALIGRTGACVQ